MNAIQNYVWGLSKKPQSLQHLEPVNFENYPSYDFQYTSTSLHERFYLKGASRTFEGHGEAQFIEVITDVFSLSTIQQQGDFGFTGEQKHWVVVDCGGVTYGFDVTNKQDNLFLLKLPEPAVVIQVFAALGFIETVQTSLSEPDGSVTVMIERDPLQDCRLL